MRSSTGPWTLIEHPEPISLVRLAAGTDIPPWADGLPLTSVSWSATETTVVCPSRCVPDSLPGTIEGPMTAFELADAMPFTVSGVMAGLAVPLAEAQVSLFSLSTFDTHWVLVAGHDTRAAKASWARHGHVVVHPGPAGEHPYPSAAAVPPDVDGPTDRIEEQR